MSSDTSLAIADALPHIVWIHGESGAAEYFNRRWYEYTGLSGDVRGSHANEVVHPDDRDSVERLMDDSRKTDQAVEAWYRLRRNDGEYRWHRGVVVPFARTGDRVTKWIGTATDADTEKRMWNEQKFLARASRVLGTSLDVSQTLSDVAKLVVPDLADWCAIDLLNDDGTIHRPAVAHIDPAKVDLAWRLWEKLPPKPDDPHGVYAVTRTRQPEHFEHISDELLVQAALDEEHLAIVRSLGLRSSMCVPLVARDHVLGALSLVSAESGRRYRKRDLEFATEFARRIAIAVDNAKLYTEATRARSAAEAMAADLIEQSRSVETALVNMRRERDEALAKLR